MTDLESTVNELEPTKFEQPAFFPFTGSMMAYIDHEFQHGRYPQFTDPDAVEQLKKLELLINGTLIEVERSDRSGTDPLRIRYDAFEERFVAEDGTELSRGILENRYTVFIDQGTYRDTVARLEQEREEDRMTAVVSDMLFAAEHEKWTPTLTGVETFVNFAKIGYFTPETEIKVYDTDGSEEIYRYGPGVGELTGGNGVRSAREVLESRPYELKLDQAHIQKVWNDIQQGTHR